MSKRHLFLGSLFLVAVLTWSVFFSWPSKNLSVYLCDVGQGDAIFINSPSGFQILIDGGPSNKVLECLSKAMPFWDRKIDLVVLTHPHSDHITGQIEVLERYKVGQILSNDAPHTTPEYFHWLDLIKKKKIPLELAQTVKAIDLGQDAKVEVLYPKESFRDKKIENLNNTSVVLRLEYAGVSFLFMGDLEKSVQQKIISTWSGESLSVFRATFLKVPHHGSKNAIDEDFLNLVSPKIALISVGENRFGHPAKETLEKLKKHNIDLRRTDQLGTIKIFVDKTGKWNLAQGKN